MLNFTDAALQIANVIPYMQMLYLTIYKYIYRNSVPLYNCKFTRNELTVTYLNNLNSTIVDPIDLIPHNLTYCK